MLIWEQFPDLRRVANRDIGIEVETEGRGLADGHGNPLFVVPGWSAERDGSLRGESMEWVLSAPIPRKNVNKLLKSLSGALKENGVVLAETDRCGVHVHVNIQDFTYEQAMNFIILYLIVEKLLVRYCGDDREGNLFCLRACDADMMIYQLRECRKRGSLKSMANDNFRYASINLAAVAKYGSLEFRALKTPKNVMDIEQWVNLLLRVRDAALVYETCQQVVEGFSKNGELPFLQALFGDLYDVIYYEGCEVDLRDGVRRVQEVAYTKEQPKKAPIYNKNHEWLMGQPIAKPPRVLARAVPVAPHQTDRLELQVINGHPQFVTGRQAKAFQDKGWLEPGDEAPFHGSWFRWNGFQWAPLTREQRDQRKLELIRQIDEGKVYLHNLYDNGEMPKPQWLIDFENGLVRAEIMPAEFNDELEILDEDW